MQDRALSPARADGRDRAVETTPDRRRHATDHVRAGEVGDRARVVLQPSDGPRELRWRCAALAAPDVERPGVERAPQEIGSWPALLHSRAAWTFALDGDVDATAHSLGFAEEAFAQRVGETPDYAAWIDETGLAIMSGRCWSELRRPLRAVPILESALGRYSDAHARDKALYSSWLAASYIDAGEIEQAAAVVRSSLEVMGDVASVRPRQRLAAVTSRLTEHRDLSAVRDILSSDALNPLDIRR